MQKVDQHRFSPFSSLFQATPNLRLQIYIRQKLCPRFEVGIWFNWNLIGCLSKYGGREFLASNSRERERLGGGVECMFKVMLILWETFALVRYCEILFLASYSKLARDIGRKQYKVKFMLIVWETFVLVKVSSVLRRAVSLDFCPNSI